jgi:hypothetical protein
MRLGTAVGEGVRYIITAPRSNRFLTPSRSRAASIRKTAMKKATHADAVLIARSMNMKVDVVWDIIGGMNYSSYSELVMAVLICLKPLPIEKLSSPNRTDLQ